MSTADVDAWFESYDNPMKAVVQRVRQILLTSEPRLAECIKWKSPTFTYKGNLASFNPRSKSHASLMFHTGASIPGTFASLTGSGDTARYLKIPDLEAAERLAPELKAIAAAWCDARDAS